MSITYETVREIADNIAYHAATRSPDYSTACDTVDEQADNYRYYHYGITHSIIERTREVNPALVDQAERDAKNSMGDALDIVKGTAVNIIWELAHNSLDKYDALIAEH